MGLKYWFKIGRDYGIDKKFSYPVRNVEEAILVDNVICFIANSLKIEDSVGGLVQTDEYDDWEDYYDPDTLCSFEEVREENKELKNKRPNHLTTEKIVKDFVNYLDSDFNYKFLLNITEAILDSI